MIAKIEGTLRREGSFDTNDQQLISEINYALWNGDPYLIRQGDTSYRVISMQELTGGAWRVEVLSQ